MDLSNVADMTARGYLWLKGSSQLVTNLTRQEVEALPPATISAVSAAPCLFSMARWHALAPCDRKRAIALVSKAYLVLDRQ